MEKVTNRIIAISTTVIFLFLAINVSDIGLEKIAANTPATETIAAVLIFAVLSVMTIFSALFAINYFKDQVTKSRRLSRQN